MSWVFNILIGSGLLLQLATCGMSLWWLVSLVSGIMYLWRVLGKVFKWHVLAIVETSAIVSKLLWSVVMGGKMKEMIPFTIFGIFIMIVMACDTAFYVEEEDRPD